jgi:protein-S-isoprenylcysteine O-methyltransferase Ste14
MLSPEGFTRRRTLPADPPEHRMRYYRARLQLRNKEMKRSALMVTIIPLLAIAYLVYEFAHPPWTAMRLAGLLLMTPALILLTVSRIQLGNSFSVRPQATQLVVRGIYSRIRNPIYVFGTLVFTGLFLFLERPFLLLLLVPVLILQISRARAEARVLEAHFGDEYRQYKAHTWF